MMPRCAFLHKRYARPPNPPTARLRDDILGSLNYMALQQSKSYECATAVLELFETPAKYRRPLVMSALSLCTNCADNAIFSNESSSCEYSLADAAGEILLGLDEGRTHSGSSNVSHYSFSST